MRCQNCGTMMNECGSRCLNCGAAIGDSNPAYPMKWFKFLTKIALRFGGILMLLLSMAILLGIPYSLSGSDATLVYSQVPLLMIVDTILGILCCGLGVLYLVTRVRLLRFRKSGPILLYLSYGLSVLFPVVYTAVTKYCFSPAGTPLLGLSEISELAGMLLGIGLNMVYFKKRQHMFH